MYGRIFSDYDCYCMVDEDHLIRCVPFIRKKYCRTEELIDAKGSTPDADPAQGTDQIHPSGEQLL